MIIILKGADFSANNIGSIVIPRDWDEFTLNAIQLSGNVSMSVKQKNALDVFFENIGAFGTKSQIWSKLDKVYLPMICDNLNKSCINYITGNTDAVPDSSWIQLRNHGIARIDDAVKGDSLILDTSYVWNWGNKSAFLFNTETLERPSSIRQMIIHGNKAYSAAYEGLYIYSSDTTANTTGVKGVAYNNVIVNVNSDMQDKNSPSLKGISCNGETVVTLAGDYSANGNIKDNASQYFSSIRKPLLYAKDIDGYIGEGSKSVGAMILGEYLTKDECDTLSEAFDDLWAAFNT